MIGERTPDGWELRLRPRGPGRFVSAGFLLVWLCGWALGEAFALWLLLKGVIALVTGQPPGPGRQPLEVGVTGMTGAFLLLWLSIWTLGGIAAIAELLRSLWGEDRLRVSSGRLTLTRVRGPFRTERVFEREAIRRVLTLAPHELLALDSGTQRVELSRLGTREERTEAVPALEHELGIPESRTEPGQILPSRWEEVVTPAGERALVPNMATRRLQTRAATTLALGAAVVTFLVVRDSLGQPGLVAPAVVALLGTIALAAWAVWLARARKEWRLEPGLLTLRKRYGVRARDVFVARKLVLESTSDSDGDIWYELYGLGESDGPAAPRIAWRPKRPKNSRTIDRLLNDWPAALDLAAWLAREARLVLEDRTTPEAQAVELAKLRTALASSGPFGRWAAKCVDRLSERRDKSE